MSMKRCWDGSLRAVDRPDVKRRRADEAFDSFEGAMLVSTHSFFVRLIPGMTT